jgi:hypothetical protein
MGSQEKGKPIYGAAEVSTRTTIVGGQPPDHQRSQVRVPAGVERVLCLAAVDPEFRAALLGEDRERAIARRRLRLRESERRMLQLAPAAQLEAAIQGLDISPENLERRRFMGAVAASAAAIAAAGGSVAGCGDNDQDKDSGVPTEAGLDVAAGMDAGRLDRGADSSHDGAPDDALPLDDTVVTDDTVGLDLSWGSRPNDAAPAGIRPDDGS